MCTIQWKFGNIVSVLEDRDENKYFKITFSPVSSVLCKQTKSNLSMTCSNSHCKTTFIWRWKKTTSI